MDTLIASNALAVGATLVTNNTKHFSKVRGLKLENWV
jgi:tRNA(fMet)-specific endonuclease VapC